MLNLDQVRLLENRVGKAVERIQSLTAENTHLRAELSGLQTRVNELEGLVRSFKDDQGRIEEGILNALDRLSAFEDSVFHADQPIQIIPSPPINDHTDTEQSSFADSSEPIIPQAEMANENSGAVDIEAEWQEDAPSQAETRSSPDGQMDIF